MWNIVNTSSTINPIVEHTTPVNIQNAINNAEEGSVIVLSDRNYAIDAIAIDKNIVIYSEGLANISSSDNSKTFFRIASKEENPDLTNVEINGLNGATPRAFTFSPAI